MLYVTSELYCADASFMTSRRNGWIVIENSTYLPIYFDVHSLFVFFIAVIDPTQNIQLKGHRFYRSRQQVHIIWGDYTQSLSSNNLYLAQKYTIQYWILREDFTRFVQKFEPYTKYLSYFKIADYTLEIRFNTQWKIFIVYPKLFFFYSYKLTLNYYR